MKIQDILKSDLFPVVTGLYENPHIITDIRGNIFFYNKPAEELLNISTDRNIFDIFTGQSSELFYSIIKNRKNCEDPVITQLSLKSGESAAVQLRYSFINRAEEEFLSCIFTREHLKLKTGNELTLSSETEMNIYSPLLEAVKEHFPFTMMGKDVIRKKADELKEFFWIKDTNKKFLLVNKTFCEYLGMPYEKIEGTDEEDYIPEYLKKISSSIYDYILTSGRGVKSSGILSGSHPYGKERVEFPLMNRDNKIFAVAGMTVAAEKKEASENSVFEALPGLFALIDYSGNIIHSNDEFRKLFNIDKKNSRIHFEKYFSKEVCLFINSFIKSSAGSEYRILSGTDFVRNIHTQGYTLHLKRTKIQKEDNLLIYFDELKSQADMQDNLNLKGRVYDILIQSNPEPVFIYERENLRFIEVNQSALNLYGFSKSEFLQMDLTDLYAPEDIQTLLSALNESIKEGEFSGPFRQKKKDGSFIFVEISKFTLKYGDKDAHFNIIRDVSAKIEVEKECRLFKSAFDNTEQLVFVTDPSGFIIFSNNHALTSIGYTEKNLQKTSFAALVKDEERSNITGIFKSLKKDSKRLTIDLKDSKGGFLPVDLIITPTFDYKNDIDAFTIFGNIKKDETVKEITKEIVVERIMPADNHVQTDNMLLLSSLFHEILTPINVILGFVQEITESIGELTPEQKEASEIINQNRTSLLNTMNSIVEYYNVEKKTPDLDLLDVSAKEVMDHLQNDFKELKQSRGIEVIKGNIISSFYFQTDKSKFANLLFLLTKIAGYLTKEKKIYLSLYPVDNENFAVTFKNNSESITPSLLDELIKIFSPGGMSNNGSGLPKLSLRLASRLLTVFNAELYIREDNSEIGFTFPAKYNLPKVEFKTDIPAIELLKPITPEIKSTPFPIAKPAPVKDSYLNLSQFKCLYIEDQIDSQILFKVQMKELGITQFAASFEEALPLMDSNHFDFIVIDINLQGEYNGLDALRIIRKMPDHRNIPVIAVTAYLMPGDREKYISAGFNEFVAKPIFREKMIDAIERIFRNK